VALVAGMLGNASATRRAIAVFAIAVAGLVLLAAGAAYLVVTWVLIGLASLGIGESCKPGC
jgi:hypothetical protein